MTSSWFFLSTLNYDARSTTHQINILKLQGTRGSRLTANWYSGEHCAAFCHGCEPEWIADVTFEEKKIIVPVFYIELFPITTFARRYSDLKTEQNNKVVVSSSTRPHPHPQPSQPQPFPSPRTFLPQHLHIWTSKLYALPSTSYFFTVKEFKLFHFNRWSVSLLVLGFYLQSSFSQWFLPPSFVLFSCYITVFSFLTILLQKKVQRKKEKKKKRKTF